jgi:hypothetical protein
LIERFTAKRSAAALGSATALTILSSPCPLRLLAE